jgi:RNA polymerase sigma-70 factor (ECF subfamily)
MRIAINLQRDHWRSRRVQFWRRTKATSIDLDEVRERLLNGESSPEAQVAAREQLGEVWKTVYDLPARQRTVILLRFVHEMDLQEIARTTNLTQGSVKSYLSRALRKVRTRIKEVGCGHSGGTTVRGPKNERATGSKP